MTDLAKRTSVAIAFMAVAGGAVLGAGSTASAAAAVPEHAQRPDVSVETGTHRRGGEHGNGWDRGDRYGAGCAADYRWDRLNDSRWDHGISYLWEGRHGWRHGGDRDERYSDDCYCADR